MTTKPRKSKAYSVRVDFNIPLYMKVKEYLTHYKTLNHYRSGVSFDPESNKNYICIYVDYKYSMVLNPDKMYGASLERCSKIPKDSRLDNEKIIDTIMGNHRDLLLGDHYII